jgi:hypothetical protein
MSTQPPRDSFPAGAVTSSSTGSEPVPSWNAPGDQLGWPSDSAGQAGAPYTAGAIVEPAGRPTRTRSPWLWWGGGAGLIALVGIVVVLVLVSTGGLGSGAGPFAGSEEPSDVRPPLARLCPPPSAFADPSQPPNPGPGQGPSPDPNQSQGPGQTQNPSPPPPGPRTVDEDAGISYPSYGDPWEPWPFLWRMGTLEVPYGMGQHFVTEFYGGGEYHASILSAAVPATVNDGMIIDVECTGRQVAADVRAEYYPRPNTMDLLRDELTTLGGMEAWVTTFRLHFDEPGLTAKDELVGVAVIDVGKPTAAVLFISIPGTHKQWDYVVDEVLAGVRPA